MAPAPEEISRLLRAWSEGDGAALDQLMPLVYDELRQMAKNYMERQQAGHTLQTTALIHETYLRLADQREARWQNRAHFFAVAATAMRHILVDHARTLRAAKRGGPAQQVTLNEAAAVPAERAAFLAASCGADIFEGEQ